MRYSTATRSQIVRDDLKNIKQLVAEAVELWKQEYKNKITAIKVEITDIKASHQAFISKKYYDLSIEQQKLLQINAQKNKEISTLNSQAAQLENQGFKEIEKNDGLEQYGRR